MLLLGAILLAIFVLPSPWNVLVVALGAAGEIGETLIGIRLTQRMRAKVGAETLVGAEARVRARCAPEGQVEVRGELWKARCDHWAEAGETVRVRALDGLTLVVERTTATPPPAAPRGRAAR